MKKFYAIAAFMLLVAATAVAANEVRPLPKGNGAPVQGKEIYVGLQEAPVVFQAMPTEAEVAANQASLKAQPTADQAYYYRPAGCFFHGSSTGGYAQYAPYLSVPPYRTIKFKAQEASDYSWAVQQWDFDLSARAWTTMTGQSIDATYVVEADSVPVLTVGSTTYHLNGGNTTANTNYSWVVGYPDPAVRLTDSNNGVYYACPTYIAYRSRDNKSSACTVAYTGLTAPEGATYGYWFGRNASGFEGIASYCEDPTNPYALRGLVIRYQTLAWADSTNTSSFNADLTAIIYKASKDENDMLVLGDKINEYTIPITANATAGGYLYCNFPETLVIKEGIAIVITGYNNPNILSFSMQASRDTWDNGYGCTGYFLQLNEEGNLVPFASFGERIAALGKSGPAIFMDVYYPWMNPYFEDETLVRNFDENGEILDEEEGPYIFFDSYESPDAWTVESDAEWAHVQLAAYEPSKDNTDGEYSGIAYAVLSADANADTAERTATITLTATGVEPVVVTINQNGSTPPTAINVVDAAKNLESVTYYNLAGVESATPFQGVNIEVKKYSDGSKTTSKVVR